jgi:hypothetical protein
LGIKQPFFAFGGQLFWFTVFFLLMAEAGGSSAAAGGNDGSKVIGVIGDEDTVCGFLLAGVGQKDAKGTNFLVVGASAWSSARSTTGLSCPVFFCEGVGCALPPAALSFF